MNRTHGFAIATLAALSISSGMAQGAPRIAPKAWRGTLTLEGLTPSEKGTATHLLAILSPADRDLMRKDAGTMTDMIDSQLASPSSTVGGLSKAQRARLSTVVANLTPEEARVYRKMRVNSARVGLSVKHRQG